MTLLAELFDRLDATPLAVAQAPGGALAEVVEVGAPVLASEAHHGPEATAQATRWSAPTQTHKPAAEAASEATRNAWTITRGGMPICRMVGAPCTRAEALADARWRWPDADILEHIECDQRPA